jgi:hypothetical protein
MRYEVMIGNEPAVELDSNNYYWHNNIFDTFAEAVAYTNAYLGDVYGPVPEDWDGHPYNAGNGFLMSIRTVGSVKSQLQKALEAYGYKCKPYKETVGYYAYYGDLLSIEVKSLDNVLNIGFDICKYAVREGLDLQVIEEELNRARWEPVGYDGQEYEIYFSNVYYVGE